MVAEAPVSFTTFEDRFEEGRHAGALRCPVWVVEKGVDQVEYTDAVFHCGVHVLA